MKSFLFTLYFIAFSCPIFSQTIDFNFNDGTYTSYNLEDVRKITFDVDIMNLHMWNGTIFSWDIASIDQYEYDENASGLINAINDFGVEIFPNPVLNNINLKYNLPNPKETSLEIYDLSGKLIKIEEFGLESKGEIHHIIDLENLESGSYNICLKIGKDLAIKKIIKK